MKQLGSLVSQSLARGGMMRQINASMIVEVSDQFIAAALPAVRPRAKTISHTDNTLFIGVKDSIAAGEIFFRRLDLIREIKTRFPGAEIKRIIFKPFPKEESYGP